jgi:hypothetical protein
LAALRDVATQRGEFEFGGEKSWRHTADDTRKNGA